MNELSLAVREALTGSDMGTAVIDVKNLLCDELGRIDPRASIHQTNYFNHTYIPDVVVEWDSHDTRDVYLRFVTDARRVSEDGSRIGGSGPVLFDLSLVAGDHASIPAVDDSAVRAAVSDYPGLMLTDTEAAEHIRPQTAQNLVERVVISNLLRGGRGLLTESVARQTVDVARAGFSAAVNADPDPVRATVDVVRSVLSPAFERRVERTLQLLWWAGGGTPEDFPVSLPDDMDLNPQDTREFLRSMFTDEQPVFDSAFWDRLAARLDFDMLTAAGDVPASGNLDQLMKALASRLELSHVVVDSHPRPLPPYDELSWSLADQFLVLNGPSWSCRFTPHGNRFSQRRDIGLPISLAAASSRCEGYLVDEAEIEETSRRVQFSRKPAEAEGVISPGPSITTLVEGFPGEALVRKIVVIAGTRRLAAEFDRMMLSATPDASVQQMARAATRILVPLDAHEQRELSEFLDQ